MFENEWFPAANSMGVSWGEFWHMNPRIINLLAKGRKEKLKEIDYMNWLSNQYTLSAVLVAVEHNLAGRKAKSKYIKEPIMSRVEGQGQKISEDELQKQRELFVARLQAMKANWDIEQERQ